MVTRQPLTTPRLPVAVKVPHRHGDTGKLVLSQPARLIPLLLALAWLSLTDRLLPVALGGEDAARGDNPPQQSSSAGSSDAVDPASSRTYKQHYDNHAAQMALYMVRCPRCVENE